MSRPEPHHAEITPSYMNGLEALDDDTLLAQASDMKRRRLTAYGSTAERLLMHQRARETVVALRALER